MRNKGGLSSKLPFHIRLCLTRERSYLLVWCLHFKQNFVWGPYNVYVNLENLGLKNWMHLLISMRFVLLNSLFLNILSSVSYIPISSGGKSLRNLAFNYSYFFLVHNVKETAFQTQYLLSVGPIAIWLFCVCVFFFSPPVSYLFCSSIRPENLHHGSQ